MVEIHAINTSNFESTITGGVIPPDRYQFYINGVGPIAWTMKGMSELTKTVKVNHKQAALIIDHNEVVNFITNPNRLKVGISLIFYSLTRSKKVY